MKSVPIEEDPRIIALKDMHPDATILIGNYVLEDRTSKENPVVLTFGAGARINGKPFPSKKKNRFPAASGILVFIPLKIGYTDEGSPEDLLENGIKVYE